MAKKSKKPAVFVNESLGLSVDMATEMGMEDAEIDRDSASGATSDEHRNAAEKTCDRVYIFGPARVAYINAYVEAFKS